MTIELISKLIAYLLEKSALIRILDLSKPSFSRHEIGTLIVDQFVIDFVSSAMEPTQSSPQPTLKYNDGFDKVFTLIVIA